MNERDHATDRVYQVILDYVMEHGYPPSYREIADEIGLRSISTIHYHIEKLLEDGRLETDTGKCFPRAIRLAGYEFRKKL